jgi:glycosyltransferase involved in cell wall biosynthesis
MHPPLDKRVFDKEAISLVEAGFDVCHLAPGDGDEFNKNNVRVITYQPPKGIWDRIIQFPRLYRLAAKLDADCYHCNEVDSWFIGVLLKIFRRKRCVFDVHEHYPSTFAESRFPLFMQPLVASIIRTVFRVLTPFTDYIVLAKRTVSSDFHCSPEKKIFVRNFSPLKALNNIDKQDIHQYRNNYNIRIIHLGLISRLRGWPQMLEALSATQNKNIELLIIGEFNDGSRAEFDKQVSVLGLHSRVFCKDGMPFDEAFQYIVTSDIGLILFQLGIQNHTFALPHKMFDYMLGELAVVAPAFAEEVAPIIKEADCGFLVDPANTEELSRILDYLAEHPDEIKRMGKNGKQAVVNEFNWENEASKLIDMYHNMENQNK